MLYFTFLSDTEATEVFADSFKKPFKVPNEAEIPSIWQELRNEINNESADTHYEENKNEVIDRAAQEIDCDGLTRLQRISAIRSVTKDIMERIMLFDSNLAPYAGIFW